MPDGQKLAYTDLDHKIHFYDLSTHEDAQTGVYGYVTDWVNALKYHSKGGEVIAEMDLYSHD